MRDLVELVADGDYLHRRVPGIGWSKGDQSRHDVGLAQAPIGRILVPGDKGWVCLLLDKEIRRPAEKVWTVKVFDRVQNPGVADQIGEPSKQEMRLVPQVTAERPTCLALE